MTGQQGPVHRCRLEPMDGLPADSGLAVASTATRAARRDGVRRSGSRRAPSTIRGGSDGHGDGPQTQYFVTTASVMQRDAKIEVDLAVVGQGGRLTLD